MTGRPNKAVSVLGGKCRRDALMWAASVVFSICVCTMSPADAAVSEAGSAHSTSVAIAGKPAGQAKSEAEAIKLLDGINPAAKRLDYQGSFVFQRNATVQSSRIVHFVEGHDQYQKVDGLDGAPRSVIQHNDDVFTFLQNSKTVILDQRKGQDNFPALLSGGSAHILDVYHVSITGSDRVAGIDCRVVALTPNDAFRFAYRLSVDPASGLLVRAQTLDSDGSVLEQVAFSQVQMGPVAADSRKVIRDSLHQLSGWKVVRAPVESVNIESAGWTLDPGVPGFHKVLELRRPMAAREAGAPPIPVDQAVFSDGVTAVSLFIEPIDKSDRKPGEGRSGATHLLAEQHGDFWITLIGEVPALTLRRFASTIRFAPSAAPLTASSPQPAS